MSLIALPTGFEFDTSFSLDVPAQVNRSGWTGRRKVSGLPGVERWFMTAQVEAIATELEECKWRAFMLAMRGVQNYTNFIVACQKHVGPKPTVAASATTGYTCPLQGMTVSTTILRAGQFMTIPLPSGHDRLVCLTSDLVTDASGDATASFEPTLPEAPDEDDTVETAEPYCPINLVERRNGWSVANGVASFVIDGEEAL